MLHCLCAAFFIGIDLCILPITLGMRQERCYCNYSCIQVQTTHKWPKTGLKIRFFILQVGIKLSEGEWELGVVSFFLLPAFFFQAVKAEDTSCSWWGSKLSAYSKASPSLGALPSSPLRLHIPTRWDSVNIDHLWQNTKTELQLKRTQVTKVHMPAHPQFAGICGAEWSV